MSMIYKEGTASLTKGSPVLKGKDTYFLNPIFNVGVGQIVQVKTGDNVYVNSIKEVVDNETLILSFDSLQDVTDGEIVIMITMVDSISDTANKLLGMTRGLVQFETEMTKWFTSMDKKITITLPDGTKKEVYTLQTIMEQVAQNEKEMQELLQNSEKKVNDMVDKAQTDVNQVVTDGTNKINQAVDKADKEINEAITSGTGKIDTMLTESQKKIDKTIEDTEIKVDTELGKIDEKIGNSLDGKVNKTGDTMTGALTTTTKVITQSSNGENSVGFVSNNSGVSFIEYKKGSDYHTNKIPEKSGTILLSGDFGLGSNAVDDGSVPRAQTPKDANEITSSGFYAGGGSSALNYFNNYFPLVSFTRTGGDGTGYITHIQGSNSELAFRHRLQGKWTDWIKLASLSNPGTQMFRGQVTSYSGIYCSEDDTFKDYFGLKRPQKGNPYGFYLAYGGSGYSINFPERTGGTILVQSGNQSTIKATNDYAGLTLARSNGYYSLLETNPSEKEGADGVFCNLVSRAPGGSNKGVISFSENVSGTVLVNKTPNTVKKQSINRNGFYQCQDIEPYNVMFMGVACTHVDSNNYVFSMWGRGNRFLFSTKDAGNWSGTWEVWTTANAIADTNGFIKKASPIIDINPDGTFATNDESEGATVTRVAQGEYLIEGVLGFNSDAGWGGVDGGIEIPLDVNKQPLIWVDSEVLEDGSIIIRTYHREHKDVPPFARNLRRGYNDGDPCDIPTGRFISIRVNMPENSIFNTRERKSMEEMREMESNPFYKEERAFPNIIFNKKGDL